MEKEVMQILTQDELTALGEPKVKVTSKPTATLYVCIILGILMIVTKRFWVLGVLVLPTAIFALIKIPEEGHYDENSIISVPISDINNNLGGEPIYFIYQ